MTRPRGSPPMPSAISRPSEPVETASTSYDAAASPRRMTEPLPNCFSIWPSAAESAFLRLSSIWKSPLRTSVFGEAERIKAGCINPQEKRCESLNIRGDFRRDLSSAGDIQGPRIDNTVYRARFITLTLHEHESFAVHAQSRRQLARPLAFGGSLRGHFARQREMRAERF